MSNIIGVCGYHATGSSTVCKLLREFDDAQVFDKVEFTVAREPDGLQDLDYQLNRFGHYAAYPTAISRFRKLMSNSNIAKLSSKKEISELTNEFLDNIVQVKWKGHVAPRYAGKSRIWATSRKKFRKVIRMASRAKIKVNWLEVTIQCLSEVMRQFTRHPAPPNRSKIARLSAPPTLRDAAGFRQAQ